jgi:hypothetical protein
MCKIKAVNLQKGIFIYFSFVNNKNESIFATAFERLVP